MEINGQAQAQGEPKQAEMQEKDQRQTLSPTQQQPAELPDISTALDRALDLLTTRDDTSLMCGLVALKVILDRNPRLVEDSSIITKCWLSISGLFLERLLKSKGQSTENAVTMLNLAVSLMHAFVRVLPSDHIEGEKLIKRSKTLISCLNHR